MEKAASLVREQVCPLLAPNVRSMIENIPAKSLSTLEEIRLRHSRPLAVYCKDGEKFINKNGPVFLPGQAYLLTGEDLAVTLELLSGFSLYAFEEELKQGYLTVPGGHRVGLAGRAVVEQSKIRVFRDISSLNIRIAREIRGVGEKVLPFLLERRTGRILHTLIVSPPQGGKTTLLRDLARLLSDGAGILGLGQKVGIVDERSEIAGSYLGVPQLDVGVRSDILDACPKAEGIMILLRSLSPRVIITDEIGRDEDVRAIEEAVYAGVTVISTAHGLSFEDVFRRPVLSALLERNYFERLVFLSTSRGPGTVEMIVEGEKGLPLYSAQSGGV